MTRKPEPDPYSVLGVARTATDAEIRAAYLPWWRSTILIGTRAIP
jgi:hypothetical protein